MIRLNNDWVIFVDTYNYSPARDTHKTDKKGNAVYDAIGHYSNLANAVIAIREREITDVLSDGECSLAQAIAIIHNTTKEFIEIVKGAINND